MKTCEKSRAPWICQGKPRIRRGSTGMLTLELAWLELWLDATTGHRPPAPDKPLPQVEAAATGLAIAIAIGTTLALVAGLSRRGEDAVDATMQMLRTLPFLALVPLFILWFGIGETPKIALVALGATFPIYVTLFAGIRGVDA